MKKISSRTGTKSVIGDGRYNPEHDRGHAYSRWGKAADIGEVEKTASPSIDVDAYREYMKSEPMDTVELSEIGSYTDEEEISKEAGDFTFTSERPILPPLNQNIKNVGPDREVSLHPHGMHEVETNEGGESPYEIRQNESSKSVIHEKMREQERIRMRGKSLPTSVKVDRRNLTSQYSTNKMADDRSVFENDDLNPLVMYHMLNNMWGEEWLEWEPETIIQTAEMDGFKISSINLGKIFALRVVIKTDRFFTEPRIFEKVVRSFSNKVVDWGTVQRNRVHEIAAAIALIDRYVRDGSFSDDIAAYVAACALSDGYVLLPPQLSFAEFPFSIELATNMGDDAVNLQEILMEAINNEDVESVPKEHMAQYMRLMRCQFEVQGALDEVR